MDTTPIVFTVDELWLLRSCVRHEIPQQESWKCPPASYELNKQIAETILAAHENALTEAALLLTERDCLVIDAVTPQDAKDANGHMLGKSVLIKSFEARRSLEGGPIATVDEPEKRLAHWLATRKRTPEARHANPNTSYDAS